MVSGLNHPTVGNDLVGWESGPNCRKSGDLRFVQRVFTETEQRFIAQSSRPDFALWWLWAAKESCYKAVVKTTPTVFSPARFAVNPLNQTVLDPNGQLWAFDSNEGVGWLHVWLAATDADLARVLTRVDVVGDDESRGVRRLAMVLVSDHGHANCSIEGRPPAVHQAGRRISGDLSLSHDEGFGAVAWLSGA